MPLFSEEQAAQQAIGLTVLFSGLPSFDEDDLQARLRALHRHTSRGLAETVAAGDRAGMVRLTWGDRVVDLVHFGLPSPAEQLQPAMVRWAGRPEMTLRLAEHRAHAHVLDRSPNADPLERYAVAAAVAAMLGGLGGSFVVNERGHASIPLEAAVPDQGKDAFAHCRNLLLALFIGTVAYADGRGGLWLRTCGADAFDWPDLALHGASQDEAREGVDLMADLLGYCMEGTADVEAGHTLSWGGRNYRLRPPLSDESFLRGPGRTLVVEPTSRGG